MHLGLCSNNFTFKFHTISATLRLAKHSGVQSLEMPKNVPEDKDRAALPGQTASRTVPGDGFPNQAGWPREGLQSVSISQDEWKKGGAPQIPSPSSPQRLSYFSVSVGSSLEGQRCAPSFFGTMPGWIRCQHQFPVVHERVIKRTNKTADRGVPTLG